jgi:hypothetical protein
MDEAIPDDPPFRVEIVGAAPGAVALASGIPLVVQRAVVEVEATDIVIVPSVVVGPACPWARCFWRGRYRGCCWASA